MGARGWGARTRAEVIEGAVVIEGGVVHAALHAKSPQGEMWSMPNVEPRKAVGLFDYRPRLE